MRTRGVHGGTREGGKGWARARVSRRGGMQTYRTLASIFQVMSARRRTASSSLAFQRK